MNLMKVKNVMTGKNNQTILTGPLLIEGISSRSEIEAAFGQKVFISSERGKRVCVPVNGFFVSQAMAGNFQVSISVNYLDQEDRVALDSIVGNEK